ncbi:hypothetical protein HDU98_008989 [Podochytrium sp. JEL0797]|nr:hypothetical protein HDU98_008989 [Podochytrium sp. JEL0797]
MPNTTSPSAVRKRKSQSKPSAPGPMAIDSLSAKSDSSSARHLRHNDASSSNSSLVKALESKKHHSHHKSIHARRTQFSARTSPLSQPDVPLRGFITFFWMGLAWYTVYTILRAYRERGELVTSVELLQLLGHDSKRLIVADAILIGSCGMCVAIYSLVKHNLVGRKTASVMSAVWVSGWFVGWMVWISQQDWMWLQTGFLTIHAISMLMKQHSYLASNGEMFWKLELLKDADVEIETLAREVSESSPVSSDGSTVVSDTVEERDGAQEKMSAVVSDAEVLRGELKGKWKHTQFPQNITISNFVDYMLVPTLVYELEYPRTAKFNLAAFLERVAGTFVAFFLLCTTVDQYVIPILQETHNMDFFTTIVYLIMPFMVCFMMTFFIIFECICNAFAELTLFADREFYQDWWNACTFDEYARRWNKPVHEFLLRHVYLSSISSYKMSKPSATLLTFFVSSVFHELVISMTGKRFRPWLFGFQMLQIPLIWMSRLEFMKTQRTFGNALFWFSMFLGPPMLAVMYAREHYLEM